MKYRSKWTYLVIFLALILYNSSTVSGRGNEGNSDPSLLITYDLETLWNGIAVEQIFRQENRMLIKNGSYEIILFEDDTLKANYNGPLFIRDVALLPNGVVLIANGSIWVIQEDSFVEPTAVRNLTENIDNIPCTTNLDSYQDIVIHPCYEHGGFLFYNFSDNLQPRVVKQYGISWHAYDVQIINGVAFFAGDTNSGVFNLSGSVTNPVSIWEAEWYYPQGFDKSWPGYYFSWRGKVGMNDEYIVHTATWREKRYLSIIPRENSTIYGKPVNVSLTDAQEFQHCVMIQDPNLLLVSDQNNTLVLFEITPQYTLREITSVYLGAGGEIRDLYYDKTSKSLYIADGGKGLLKMSEITIKVPQANLFPGPGDYMGILVGMLLLGRRRKLKGYYRQIKQNHRTSN